jgi:hypothetical protein
VLPSSAKQEELDRYLELLEIRDLVDDWTTSADVEATKPEPELVEVAGTKAGEDEAVMVFDSTAELRGRLDETPLADRYFLRLTAASNCRLFMRERPLTFRRFAWL